MQLGQPVLKRTIFTCFMYIVYVYMCIYSSWEGTTWKGHYRTFQWYALGFQSQLWVVIRRFQSILFVCLFQCSLVVFVINNMIDSRRFWTSEFAYHAGRENLHRKLNFFLSNHRNIQYIQYLIKYYNRDFHLPEMSLTAIWEALKLCFKISASFFSPADSACTWRDLRKTCGRRH